MKINLAVIFGGKSVEHEVSIISALQAIAHLDTDRYEIYPVYITKSGCMYTGSEMFDVEAFQDIPRLLNHSCPVTFAAADGQGELVKIPTRRFFAKPEKIRIDAALPITHGTNVEDGALQGFLKSVNIPFAGCDVLASAVCMDKFVMKHMLKAGGFPVVEGIRLTRDDFADMPVSLQKIRTNFTGAVIVKPVNLGSSVGISKAETDEQIRSALKLAFSFAPQVLVERAISPLREINCSVLGNEYDARPSVCEEPVAGDMILSYADKYLSTQGKKNTKAASGDFGGNKGMASLSRIIPAEIPKELEQAIQNTAVAAFKFLGCAGVARIDFLLEENGEFYINELNTIPGSLSFYLWEPAGVPYAQLLNEMISLAIKRTESQSELIYGYAENILASGNFDKGLGSKGQK